MRRAAWVSLLFGLSACATAPAGYTEQLAAVDAGRMVFLGASDPRCGSCHTLAEAGATGTLGPNLDELKPDVPRVVAAVMQGVGIMRAQEHLSEEEVQALARYVSQVAGGSE